MHAGVQSAGHELHLLVHTSIHSASVLVCTEGSEKQVIQRFTSKCQLFLELPVSAKPQHAAGAA